MLKRLAQNVTASAAKKPASSSRRRAGSDSSSAGSVPKSARRGGRPKPADTSEPETSALDTARERNAKRASRLKKAGRMKRAPLLEYRIVEAVHSAVAGEARKSARRRMLALFAKHDTKETNSVTLEQFRKCIEKTGIKLDKSEDYKMLGRCFMKSGSGHTSGSSSEDDASTRVDYPTFVDFACNTRDSATLSEIADSMRHAIAKFDRKRGKASSSTSQFDLGKALKQLDKKKQGWLPSERVEQFFDDFDEGPAFRLSAQQLDALIDRFEYEFEKETLGFDYVQFAQWLQPLLHLDTKHLHARVKELVQQAHNRHGWKLDEVFEAMDDDRNGEIDGLELKEALLDMGLPLTDAQIRGLVDEYDVDGDGRIQYEEFVSLFAPRPVKKQGGDKRKQQANVDDSRSEGSDEKKSTKPRAKRNVRNTFSWGIAKAFARKQASQQGSRPTASKRDKRKTDRLAASSSSSDENRAMPVKKKPAVESTSSEETERPTRSAHARRKAPARRVASSSSSSSSSPSEHGRSRKMAASRRKDISSDNQSESSALAPKTRKSGARRRSNGKQNDAVSTDSETSAAVRKKTKDDPPKKKKTRPVAKEDSDSDGKRQSDTDTNVTKNPTKPKPERRRSRARSPSPKTRTERSKSSATVRQKSPQRRSSAAPARHSSMRTARRAQRRSSTRSYARSPSRRTRSSQAASNAGKRVARRAATRRSSRAQSPHDSLSESSDDSDTSSGLDVEQLRQMKRSARKDRNDGAATVSALGSSDEESHSLSDTEYYKHLKRALRRAFDFFDLDHSDAIEKRELDLILRALGHDVTPNELDAELKRSDLDRNGRLDFYEFAAFVKRQLHSKAYLLTQKREMEIRHAFEALDTDKNGVLDEKEFEYLVYKVLQVELSVEEQDALLDFVDANGDGTVNVEEFIAFMKVMEEFYKQSGVTGQRRLKRQNRFLANLDGTSRLACSAMKKLVRGAPLDIDRNLLMFFDIPTNFRPAISSAATCRLLNANTMAYALSFPSPQTVAAMAHSAQRLLETREASVKNLLKRDDVPTERMILQQAESLQSQAIVSLKRATGVPKPFDTREDDVVKRCVHICLFQEREEVVATAARGNQRFTPEGKAAGSGIVVGNVHEVPVYWHAGEEDVWEFSKKTTKEDKYKFLVRTNSVNDRLYLLVEFIVHLRLSKHPRGRKQRGDAAKQRGQRGRGHREIREMVCCWCKVPIQVLLANQTDPLRFREKLWGGTAHAPVDIEQDEILRRRTGWRAVTNLFSKPTPPAMGLKSVSIQTIPEELQKCVPKMPPTLIAPFVALPIVAEYMTLMHTTLMASTNLSSGAISLLMQLV